MVPVTASSPSRDDSTDDSSPGCSICGHSPRKVFQCSGHAILECESCVHRFCDLAPSLDHSGDTYSDDYFFGGGAGYGNYLGERDLLTRHGERYGRLLKKYMRSGQLLDVGAAAGFGMKGFANCGWKPHGLEPNASMAEYANEEFGFNMDIGTLEDFETNQKFDLISMIQVIAHFHDLHAAMARAASLTNDNGYWLIETWNYRSLTARLFGQHWHEYSPPSVLRWFSPNSLAQLGERHGMKMIAKGRPKKYLNGEHAKSLLQFRLNQTAVGRIIAPLTKFVPDRMQIPYPAEDLFWMLLQKV